MVSNFEGKQPIVGKDTFIAGSADIVGDVVIGDRSSVWHQAVIRADINRVTIGETTNIQEHVSIHVDADIPTNIGNKVTLGHGAIVHACDVGDCTLIGMGAIILDGAIIGDHCLIAAGSIIPPGKNIPPRSMVMGQPGKIVKELSDVEAKNLEHHAEKYHKLALRHQGGTNG